MTQRLGVILWGCVLKLIVNNIFADYKTIMKLTMTGNRGGMSEQAQEYLRRFIESNTISEVHHGDCVGSDKTFHAIVKEYGIKIIIHPPKNSTQRAYCDGDIIMNEKDYLVRNKEMVDTADLIIAFPASDKEEFRSGTWSTIRYARKKKKALIIVYPDGTTFK